MIAEKKDRSIKPPERNDQDNVTRSQDEFDSKRKDIREKLKAKRVHYVVKDLPIY